MCEECRHSPCISRCPNFVQVPLCYCDQCGEGICSGDYFYRINIEGYPVQNLCDSCIDEFGLYAETEDEDDDY